MNHEIKCHYMAHCTYIKHQYLSLLTRRLIVKLMIFWLLLLLKKWIGYLFVLESFVLLFFYSCM